ncbi:histidine--tRNA ligase [Putridiphycobacter roseus]|uniref:Histidine--tRNA ligase n=1 Tax=Putridiphycobacter roseus TaxID=2219161 RepID=A0A2W1N1M8_9FLAO|nr:histidine--tRNA ligase [Putridiphycobacter roseus]PZE17704.1 histidine--tRNA ligase [Putridiphycobacter roseus]
MSNKPSIPKGTRDFLPTTLAKRQYIFKTISTVFKKFGFVGIETPTFENTETLMGKYGEEGDRLIFRILNSGDKVKKADITALENGELAKFANSVSEKALRYDLTVPFARFVVQHQNELTFPFKRFQIQPVWRADRPQKGRYREFYQCDVDVVGSDSLIYEIELIQIFDEVLSKLGLTDFSIKINNRKILTGIAEVCGETDKLVDITVAIDKLDKIGVDGVIAELENRNISPAAIEKIKPLFDLNGDNFELLNQMKTFLYGNPTGEKGIEELEFIFKQINALGLTKAKLEFQVTLARGLSYYTGAIFEVLVNNVKMGSICGGGRYDNLTELFGVSNMSGVGISFGADRIYDVMEMLELFPPAIQTATRILFINFGEIAQLYCLRLAKEYRDMGVSVEVYPENAKMKKQMKYANDKNIPIVVMLGDDEINKGEVTYKLMESGEQHTVSKSAFKALIQGQ